LVTEQTDCCGWGVEVVNTTAELYKGGTVTSAVIPQNDTTNKFCSNVVINNPGSGGDTPGALVGCMEFYPMNLGCTDTTTLFKFVDARQEEAKRGSYTIVPINLVSSSQNPTPVTPMALTSSINTVGAINQPVFLPAHSAVTVGGVPYGVQPRAYNIFNVDSQCTMYTGLDPKATFQAKMVGYYQQKIITDQIRKVSSKPSVPWNEQFYHLFMKLRSEAPTFTAFDNNPSGEWWKKFLGTAADVAPGILALIPHPAAKVAGAALGAAAPVLKGMAEESKTKRKQKNQAGKYGQGMKKNKQGNIVARQPKKKANIDRA